MSANSTPKSGVFTCIWRWTAGEVSPILRPTRRRPPGRADRRRRTLDGALGERPLSGVGVDTRVPRPADTECVGRHRDGVVREVNPALCALLDATPEQVRGLPAAALCAEPGPDPGATALDGPLGPTLPGWLRPVPPGSAHRYRVEAVPLLRGAGLTVRSCQAVSSSHVSPSDARPLFPPNNTANPRSLSYAIAVAERAAGREAGGRGA